MLILFKVKNFTSFRNESILDMRATTYIQHPSHVIKINKKLDLLKATALYGANASGKSNFISAMFFFETYIFSQFINKNEYSDFDSCDTKARSIIKLEPFLLTSEQNEFSEFEIIFTRNKKQYQYGFECSPSCVKSEWLYIDDALVFERTNGSVKFGTKYNNLIGDYKKVPTERLYIAVLDYFLEDSSKERVLSDFVAFFHKEFNVYTDILLESTVKGLIGVYGLSEKLVSSVNFRKQVEHYLQQVDIGIKRLDIKTEVIINNETGEKKKEKIIKTVHDVYDDKGNIVGEKSFDLRQESTGTLRFIAYIQNIIDMISEGGVFIVDEMTARLHPLITKLVCDMFC